MVSLQYALSRIKGWILLNDPIWSDDRRKEYRFIRRLDFIFVAYLCFSAVIKYMDQTNLSNAYVSGMKEDLELYSNQYNLFTTYFNIGYVLMIPFSSILANSIIRPSLLLPTLELTWGILTGCLAASRHAKDVYALRFLIGFCEGAAWNIAMILFLSWYTPSEVGRRIACYYASTTIGGVVAGFLQAALYKNLNGSHGIAGWRWLFIVNSVITVSIASVGYWACPDYPNKPNPWSTWLSKEQVKIALRRMESQERALPVGWSRKTFKDFVTRPQNWLLWIAYTVTAQGQIGNSYFNLWLQWLKKPNGKARFTVEQVNYIPTANSFIGLISVSTQLVLSDFTGLQWPFLLFNAFNGIIWSSVLSVWSVPLAPRFVAYMMMYLSAGIANLLVIWTGNIAKHSAEERALLVMVYVSTYYALQAGVPLKVYPASQAPHYKIGYKYQVAMWAAAVPVISALAFWHERDKRRQRKAAQEHLDEESVPKDVWDTSVNK